MDEQPPRRSVPPRTSRAFHPVAPSPLQTNSRLLGIAAGALAAGIWFLVIAWRFSPIGWPVALFTVLGALLIGFGLLIGGASIIDLCHHR